MSKIRVQNVPNSQKERLIGKLLHRPPTSYIQLMMFYSCQKLRRRNKGKQREEEVEAREKKRTRQDLLCSLISLKPLSVGIKTAEIPIHKVEEKPEEVATEATGR